MRLFIKKEVLAIALALSTSSAFAESIDLKVTGKIIPPACTTAFASGGGTVDFGNILTSTLNPSQATALAEIKSVPVTITCDEATRVGVTFTDQRADSRPTEDLGVYTDPNMALGQAGYFGLGFTAADSTTKIGAYTLAIGKTGATNADGKSLYAASSFDGGSSWSALYRDMRLPIFTSKAEVVGFSDDVAISSGLVSAEKLLNFNVDVSVIINSLSELQVKDEIVLDGLTSIDVVYL
ncbi:DUF1120 domain-containing protein [Citrobacter sp. Igbk 14]|uniref:DUF1120 domain-containing protein n=1 Tax=Citrobacter sp. Igbk 14 TaxID=2963960 RepID=UPI002302F7D9|nr:DUF1120 domain-containing protein [Citrobacter sp. Igbk 14]MDA8513298.1 DUF1120 domain-containing protein [Citrobacter sp. Igbk 14]